MSRNSSHISKTALGIGLLISGGVIGTFAVFAYISGNQSLIVWAIASMAVVSTSLGWVLLMSKVLDSTAQPIADHLHDGLSDDIENLQNGEVTWPIWQLIITLAAIVIYFMLLLRFHKFDAVWWGFMPVWMLSAILSALLALLVVRTDWFQDQHFETPAWVYWIAVVGMALALVLGVNRTENTRLLNLAYESNESDYNSYHTHYYFFRSGSNPDAPSYTADFDMPECSGKSCEGWGYVLLLLIFLVIVFVLIAGSAFIANFWVLAGGIFITMMILMTWQSLMLSPRRHYNYRRY